MSSTHVARRPVAVVDADTDELAVEQIPPCQPYRYTPLPALGDYFRLLELLPGDDGSSLRCTLAAYSLDAYNVPPYRALSYTWNESKYDRLVVAGRRLAVDDPRRSEFDIRHPLHCGDSERLVISTNLRDALRRLRRRSLPVKLWVDAVCINQEDDAERSRQIMLMPRIYHTPAAAVLWLGEEDHETHLGLTMIRKLGLARRNQIETRVAAADMDLAEFGLPSPDSADWGAFARLFDRPVFRRIWCVQEAAVAPEVHVLCGGEPFPRWPLGVDYDDVVDALTLVAELGWEDDFQQRYLAGEDVMFYPRHVWAARAGFFLRALQPYYLAYDLRSFQATDARDKIFAILGLLENHSHRALGELTGNKLDEATEKCKDGHASDCLHMRTTTQMWAENKWEEHGGLGALWYAANSRIMRLVRDLKDYLGLVLHLLDLAKTYTAGHNVVSDTESDTESDGEPDGGGAERAVMERAKEQADAKNTEIRHLLDTLANEHVNSDELVSYRFASEALHKTSETCESIFSLFDGGLLGKNGIKTPVIDQALNDVVQPYMDMLERKGDFGTNSTESSESGIQGIAENEELNLDKGHQIMGSRESSLDAIRAEDEPAREEPSRPVLESASAEPLEIHHIDGMEYMKPRSEPEIPVITSKPMQPWSASLAVLPDYSLSTAEVFRNFTVQCILKKQSLDILSSVDGFASGPSRNKNLPSWVPDFAMSLRGRLEPLIKPHSALNANWTASGDYSIPEVSWDPDRPGELKLTGCVVDAVDTAPPLRREDCDFGSAHRDLFACHLGYPSDADDPHFWIWEPGPPSHPDPDGSEAAAYQRLWRGQMNMPEAHMPPPPPTTLPTWPFLLRSCLQWFHPDGIRADGLTKKPWQCYFAVLALLVSQQRGLGIVSDDVTERILTELDALPGDGIMRAKKGLFGLIRSVVAGRRLVYTEGGHLIWAPETTEVGDRICLFKGGKMPFVVRQQDDAETATTFKLIGECFAFKMVFGQAAEHLEDDDWYDILLQ